MTRVRGQGFRIRRTGAIVAAVACAFAADALLGGCTRGGSSTPVATTTSPTTAASTSTASTPRPVTPALPAAAMVGTRAGAEAFFRYFWDVYNYAFATLDSDQLRAISNPKCKFCAQGLKNVGGAAAAGRRFSGGLVTLNVVVAAPIDTNGGTIVNAVLTQTEGQLLAGDGSPVRTFPLQNAIRVDTGVRWENSRWTVIEVVIGPGASSTS